MRIDKIKKIVSINNKIELIGSNSNDLIKYKTDYDFQEIYLISSIKTKMKVVKKFRSIFKALGSMNDVFITDFKAGVYKSHPLRWTSEDIVKGYQSIDSHPVYLADCLNNKDGNIIKIDIIAYVNGKYCEISVNYYFYTSEKESNDIFLSLLLDIKKYYHEDKIIKMYKRIYSYRIMKDENVDDLIDLFNSEVGFLNLLAHDIEVIEFINEEELKVNGKRLNKMIKDVYKQLPKELRMIKDLEILNDKLKIKINKLLKIF